MNFSLYITGPGGVRDYRAHVVTDDRMVGIGTMSPEGTSELRYIWRGATGTPPPKPRSKWVGEIGWFMPFTDIQNMRTGHQINVSSESFLCCLTFSIMLIAVY